MKFANFSFFSFLFLFLAFTVGILVIGNQVNHFDALGDPYSKSLLSHERSLFLFILFFVLLLCGILWIVFSKNNETVRIQPFVRWLLMIVNSGIVILGSVGIYFKLDGIVPIFAQFGGALIFALIGCALIFMKHK